MKLLGALLVLAFVLDVATFAGDLWLGYPLVADAALIAVCVRNWRRYRRGRNGASN